MPVGALSLSSVPLSCFALCLGQRKLRPPPPPQEVKADRDSNGLIEIDSLLMLHNMRYNLSGTSYKTTSTETVMGNSSGCPTDTGCFGYELMNDLDFDVNGGGTWSGNAEEGYTLNLGDTNAVYFPVNGDGAGGWWPIGDNSDPFIAEFDGRGHKISNLAIRRNQTDIGLFGAIGEGAAIRNLGLVDNLADYTGSSDNNIYIGGLVGLLDTGSSITASYATGDADGGDGERDYVGGLVGRSESSITASYATSAVNGGGGARDSVGGLVGQLDTGSSITASYATGDTKGGDGGFDSVGGLVGQLDTGSSITASYATGDADGGDGGVDYVGGLVGLSSYSSITASYATGDANGGDGNEDYAGGLVGQSQGSITSSYATGDADGGDGNNDYVGRLVGFQSDSPNTASYGFGGTIGGESVGSDGSTKPEGVSTATQLTLANAGASWDSTDTLTSGAWDFGTDEQIPALNYADYDGAGTVFDCSQFPAGACGTLILGQRQLSVRLTLAGAASVAEGTRVTLSAELSSVVASETVVRLVVVAGGAGTAATADIVIKGDVFSLTIAAGATLGMTEFTVLDDDIDEGFEILVIDIAAGDDLFSDQIIEVTIRDDDTRGVEISTTSLNLTEGERGSYTVVLTSQPNTGSVTVIPTSSDPARVSIEDISDLVFSAENWHITRTVQIITSPDSGGDTEVAITHQVVADVGGDYSGETAADVVVTVEEGGGGNGGGNDGGGGGSLGLWALVALALAHPLGPWRRRPRHSRAPSHLSDSLA